MIPSRYRPSFADCIRDAFARRAIQRQYRALRPDAPLIVSPWWTPIVSYFRIKKDYK